MPVCVQLVSCVEVCVFLSIIESFSISMNTIFFFMLIHQIEAYLKYALSTHWGFATVAVSICSVRFI